MNIPVSHNNGHLLLWVGVALLLMSVALLDTGVIVWSASLATPGQLAAFALAFASIGTGVFLTVRYFRLR